VKVVLIVVRLAIVAAFANKLVDETVVAPIQPEVAFVNVAFVEIKFVLVTVVNTAVEGVTAPIVVPLMEPPRIVAFAVVRLSAFKLVPEAVAKPNQLVDVPFVNDSMPELIEFVVKLEIVLVVAFMVEPEAVVKPNQPEVAFVAVKFVIAPFVTLPFVAIKFVAKRLVDVVFVPVAFTQVTPCWKTKSPVEVPPAN
jgi:hypothetical protein